ncbi:MAG: MotA/TolQ/ExbB proton channel family protein [Gemmatimonadota bacterium]
MIQLFQDGGWAMWPLLFLLVAGIAVTFERAYTLTRAGIDAEAFFQQLEESLRNSGPKAAAELCASTRGPVASVIHAGLLRLHRGIEHVEKAIENAGAVEMAFLERGMVWLSTIANLAPMVGFLGTVSGMIKSFSVIKAMGDIEPSAVAGGISEALITTAAGLIIGIIIQFFHNFFASRIDAIIADMQEHTAGFVDVLSELAPKTTNEVAGGGA